MLRREQILKHFLAESEKALCELEVTYGLHLSAQDLYLRLIDHFDTSDLPNEVLFKQLSAKDITKIILSPNTEKGEIITIVTLGKSILPKSIPAHFEKAIVKLNGEQWNIHRNDKDPFPSSPHAHNYPNNLRLHLGTGGLYRKKRLVGHIKEKDLLMLRERILDQMGGLPLPPLSPDPSR